VAEFATAGFFKRWTMTQAGIYFLARNPDQSVKLKFYDFADEQIKDTPGECKIPSNLDGTFITTDGNALLCSVIEKASRLMLANLP